MIHPSAYVDPQAVIGPEVTIGPHSYVGPGVQLGEGCVLHNNVTLAGHTVCGKRNVFFPCAVIGTPPQDLKYKGGLTRLVIGDDNVFREQVTVHPGTEVGGGLTRIGSNNRLMIGVHVAHDCHIGNDCILSNYTQLAGHCRIEDKATVGALLGIHHFATVGTLAYIPAMTRVGTDVPPYMIFEGQPGRVRGFNEVGMRRWGFTEEQIQAIREAYRVLFGKRSDLQKLSLADRLAMLEARPDLNGEVQYLCAAIRRSMNHGVYGRYLEHQRRDSDADRRAFYGRHTGAAEGAP